MKENSTILKYWSKNRFFQELCKGLKVSDGELWKFASPSHFKEDVKFFEKAWRNIRNIRPKFEVFGHIQWPNDLNGVYFEVYDPEIVFRAHLSTLYGSYPENFQPLWYIVGSLAIPTIKFVFRNLWEPGPFSLVMQMTDAKVLFYDVS